MNIPTPYLVFLGDAKDYKQAKVAFGVSEWRPELCVGQISLSGCEVDLGLVPMTTEQAADLGAMTFLIGISPFSTTLPDSYIDIIIDAIKQGLHIANPLHAPLPEIVISTASIYGVKIFNFRHREETYPKATGERRQGLRLLTVGTDCAVGKKFTALSIDRDLTPFGIKSTFRSTGQTGFLISQSGINMDTVQADFMAGAAEWLTPGNSSDHWDIVEGQGAVSHPSFGGGSVALLHGCQPDEIVMCHEPGRLLSRGVNVQLPGLFSEIALCELIAQRTNANAKCRAVSLFTKYVTERQLVDGLVSELSDDGYFVFDPSDPTVNEDPDNNFNAFVHYLSKGVDRVWHGD